MSRRIDDLDPRFRATALELLGRLMERKCYVVVVDTLRTAEEQAEYVKKKVSMVARSKHQDGLAMDVVPVSQYLAQPGGPMMKVTWSSTAPEWQVIGEEAEKLGLRWGGRWKVPHDPGHVEWVDAHAPAQRA